MKMQGCAGTLAQPEVEVRAGAAPLEHGAVARLWERWEAIR